MRETRILYELKTHHIAFAMAYLVLYRHSLAHQRIHEKCTALKPKQTVQQAIIREVQRNTEQRKKSLATTTTTTNENKKPNDVDAHNEMTTTNMQQRQQQQSAVQAAMAAAAHNLALIINSNKPAHHIIRHIFYTYTCVCVCARSSPSSAPLSSVQFEQKHHIYYNVILVSSFVHLLVYAPSTRSPSPYNIID